MPPALARVELPAPPEGLAAVLADEGLLARVHALVPPEEGLPAEDPAAGLARPVLPVDLVHARQVVLAVRPRDGLAADVADELLALQCAILGR